MFAVIVVSLVLIRYSRSRNATEWGNEFVRKLALAGGTVGLVADAALIGMSVVA